MITSEQAEDIAQRAGQKAAEQVLSVLGINVADADQLARWQDNIAFIDRMNMGTKTLKLAAIKTCVGSAIAGLLAALWLGVKAKLGS
jgi:hypothetical protein